MQLFRPVLFVGMGGTGLRIGDQLDRTIRQELCGPEGLELRKGNAASSFSNLEPWELPGVVQFVYADFDQHERSQIAQHVPSLIRSRNISVLSDLDPASLSYASV